MHALEGVRVIDFGQYLAGPFGPMIIGDLGADVIKVEPVTGDAMRLASKPFFGCQRGKRSLALDLKRPEGREVALALVATALALAALAPASPARSRRKACTAWACSASSRSTRAPCSWTTTDRIAHPCACRRTTPT